MMGMHRGRTSRIPHASDMDWFHLLENRFLYYLQGRKIKIGGYWNASMFSAYCGGWVGFYPQSGALFYSVPKSASSTLHLLLLYAEGLVEREALQDDDYPVYGQLQKLGYPHYKVRYHVRRREKQNFFRFSFVRNPWDRLVSCYMEKIINPNPNVKFINSMKKAYPGHNFQDMDFVDFVHFVYRLPKRQMEPHFLPQHWFFRPSAMDLVGRVENFSEDLQKLASHLSPAAREKIAGMEIPRLKKSEHLHYTQYYNDETRRLVGKKYAQDIRLFGYHFGD